MKTLVTLCIAAVVSLAGPPSAYAKTVSPHHTTTAHASSQKGHTATKKAARKGATAHAGAHAKKTTHRKTPRRVAT